MVRAGLGALALAVLLVPGCGDDDPTLPDAGEGDADVGDVDADTGVSALELEWKLDPRLNDEPVGPLRLVVTEARFSLEDLRVVGDADVLQRSSYELDFERDDAPLLRFAPAAPGIYASFVGRIKAYRVRGTIELEGEEWEFEISDEPPPSVGYAIPLQNVEVLPGETERVKLEIEIERVIEEIDWSMVEVDDGVLEVEKDSDVIDDVRDELGDAFQVD